MSWNSWTFLSTATCDNALSEISSYNVAFENQHAGMAENSEINRAISVAVSCLRKTWRSRRKISSSFFFLVFYINLFRFTSHGRFVYLSYHDYELSKTFNVFRRSDWNRAVRFVRCGRSSRYRWISRSTCSTWPTQTRSCRVKSRSCRKWDRSSTSESLVSWRDKLKSDLINRNVP